MDDIKEPILCAPNDPDAAILLSEARNDKIRGEIKQAAQSAKAQLKKSKKFQIKHIKTV